MFIREYHRYYSNRPNQPSGGVHPYHEILYISSGEFIIHWIGNTYKAKGPALFIFSPSSPHHIEQLSQNLESWFIELCLQETDNIPSLDMLHIWNMTQRSIQWDQHELRYISLALNAIDQSISTNPPKPIEDTFSLNLTCDIQKLLLLINHHITKSQTTNAKSLSPPQSHIYDLIRYIEFHYLREVTLDELSKRSGYTTSYIIRLFRDMTGLTPLQYMNDLRLNAATSYLMTTSMSIQEIAKSSGFPNFHYFSKMFKDKFGESPKNWRNTHHRKVTDIQ